MFRYHGALTLRLIVVVKIYDHPIRGAAELVCPCGVGIKSCKVPASPFGVENGEPGLPLCAETSGSDLLQLTGVGFAVVLSIHIEDEVNRWQGLCG